MCGHSAAQSYAGRREEKTIFQNLSPSNKELSEEQIKIYWLFANALIGQSMWGQRKFGLGVVTLLSCIGSALKGKDGPISSFREPELGALSQPATYITCILATRISCNLQPESRSLFLAVPQRSAASGSFYARY